MDTEKVPTTPAAVYSPTPVSVEEFVRGIEALSRGVITKQKMYDYLVSYEIRREDLERYKLWLPDRHTRNKIFRNDMIEVMLICWPVGTVTPLHTHNGQLGWMTMIEGKLLVENYRKVSCNASENEQVVGMDCLAGATQIEMEHLDNELAVPAGPLNTVDKTQTIHRILNKTEWNEPAVSMHVYSRPIDSAVVFDIVAQRCFRRDLKYDNE
jgi:cysteine dioxygenase